jgi:uncharacterized protein (DUF58 family)
MPQGKWKSLALLAALPRLPLCCSLTLVFASSIPLSGWMGLATWIGLLILTIAAGSFTVPVTDADGVSRSEKSVADAFIFWQQ